MTKSTPAVTCSNSLFQWVDSDSVYGNVGLFAGPAAKAGATAVGYWALVSLSAFVGVGASLAVYNFHRTASYQLSNADKDALRKRKNALFRHIIFLVPSLS